MTHPSHEVKKMYHVKIDHMLETQHLEALTEGMTVDGEDYRGIEVFSLGNSGSHWWYELHLYEGKYRQIRICFEQLGFLVRRLMRVAIGSVAVDGIKRGTWRYLTKSELNDLGYTPPPSARK
jgi:23S rRNA pseudouridine2605 synthase